MKLYHISTDLLHDGAFQPRVPEHGCPIEDAQTKRVCFSDSIEGCLAAIPGGGLELEKTVGETNGVFRVFEIDTEDFAPDLILGPECLHAKRLVPDAAVTGEHWILTAFQAKKSWLIQVKKWTKKLIPIVSPLGESDYKYHIACFRDLEVTSSEDPVVNARVLYPGDAEWKTFLSLGREIGGRRYRTRKDNTYSTDRNKEEFLLLAASFGISNPCALMATPLSALDVCVAREEASA